MLLLPLALASAATWVVDPAGTGDATTIQGGIALASDGDVVEVAPGSYSEDLDLQAKSVSIEGTGGSAVTFLTGTGAGPVVRVDSGEGSGTRLAGLTVSGGVGDTVGGGLTVMGTPIAVHDVVFTGNTASYGGGAGLLDADGATLTDVVFEGNTAPIGGALYVRGGSVSASGVAFTGNVADLGSDAFGGALYVREGAFVGTDLAFRTNVSSNAGAHVAAGADAAITLVDCTLSGGEAGAGAVYLNDATLTMVRGAITGNTGGYGGGIYAGSDSALGLEGVTLADNVAGYGGGVFLTSGTLDGAWLELTGNVAEGGGGLYLDGGATVTLRNSAVVGNSATASNGGGLALDLATVEMQASIFQGNRAYSGGALHVNEGSVATLTNLTLVENGSTNSAGGVRVATGGTLTLTNTIVAWSSDGSGVSAAEGSSAVVTYGDLWVNEGGATSGSLDDPTGADGNLAVDPLFVDFADDGLADDDLHLSATSTLVDAGDPTVLDADGSRSDIGAYGGVYGGAWGDAPEDTGNDTGDDTGGDDTGGDTDDSGGDDSGDSGDSGDTGGDDGGDDTGAAKADEGCGCTTGSGMGLLPALLAVGLTRRRRMAS